MIRRLFWLTLGAALGITGYRRVTAAARALRPVRGVRQIARFAGDVRDGMEIYMERQQPRAALTLEDQQPRAGLPMAGSGQPHRTDHDKDGR